ncbi:MAG: 4-hydroxy-tetrahydrodipicolinate synthase [Lentisphaerae bacterium]|jgi:4-hydroxy-tetrahydrodipicolinate synthase|nr:4-hydroxy-tetrahydrodipicolinate synthase [Lentisphaerota bacterium]MBT4823157.1 4-hydroxy-tetrahydrodipicolinate synthase [Lentisphaerota bacterium]MBT5610455.1 4-hydroxy-tetrahydrodipicolinate synthase [Lentisphaerota bacterium]MBT7061046.1 4-hydroxy-tetrahydrodipicolinate synthase [Lentisphaerota bacterium]MBT7842169.1 4-hydroxy-tetrahydrodipicolinate synthase [Lentisphaerota bacterium]
MELAGCFTAIVTPFREGRVDFTALGTLLDEQLAAGIDGIVPVGTTGESPTLDFSEHKKVVEFVAERVAGQCKIIAGTGGNATREAIYLTQHAASVGVDATLQVTPYYNKPMPEGLYRHFATVADEGGLPIVIYNVPGRTSREVDIPTIARLAEHPGVVAVKEAGGSVERVSAILDACDIAVLSGDDSLTLPMMVVGAVGVISVASNVLPGAMCSLVHAALDGRWAEAQELHRKLYPLFRDLFVETNPIPVKAGLAMLGKIEEEYRLPLTAIADGSRDVLRASMAAAGLDLG